jgi:hypothetical protein
MNENKVKLTDEMIDVTWENYKGKDRSEYSIFWDAANFARKFYEENYVESDWVKETDISKYKEFDLEECINKYDSMAIIVFDSGQTEEGSVIVTDSKVSPEHPVIFLLSDKREIYHVSIDGKRIISNSKRRVFGKLVLPLKKKTLYWNVYKDKKNNNYVVGDSYSIKSLEEATERKDRFETKEYEFVKTISVEVEG